MIVTSHDMENGLIYVQIEDEIADGEAVRQVTAEATAIADYSVDGRLLGIEFMFGEIK